MKSKPYINSSLLPNDIFSYTDVQFYNVAKQIVGASVTELLEIQSIRTPDSLLHIPDVFSILNIKCAAVNHLKEELCLKTDDNKFIVKPGIRSLMDYFRELIIKKQTEVVKILSYQKQTCTSMHSSLATISPGLNIDSFSQLQQPSCSVATDDDPPSVTIPVDENYHRNFIINSINNWCERFSSTLLLVEGMDYHLILTSSGDADVTAKIKCKCGIKVGLVKFRKNFQISNFYKHLISLSCDVIRKSKKVSTSISTNNNDRNLNNLNEHVDTSSQKEDSRKRLSSTNVSKDKRSRQNHRK